MPIRIVNYTTTLKVIETDTTELDNRCTSDEKTKATTTVTTTTNTYMQALHDRIEDLEQAAEDGMVDDELAAVVTAVELLDAGLEEGAAVRCAFSIELYTRG
jgi:hypothetical protein